MPEPQQTHFLQSFNNLLIFKILILLNLVYTQFSTHILYFFFLQYGTFLIPSFLHGFPIEGNVPKPCIQVKKPFGTSPRVDYSHLDFTPHRQGGLKEF